MFQQRDRYPIKRSGWNVASMNEVQWEHQSNLSLLQKLGSNFLVLDVSLGMNQTFLCLECILFQRSVEIDAINESESISKN